MKERIKSRRILVIPIVMMLLVFFLFREVFMIGFVPTGSMEPTIEAGSYVLGIRKIKDIQTGDIIIFEKDGSYLVKRIAACGGDEIYHNGQGVTVPDGCFYVLGDNAEDSYDSRYWEEPFVEENQVVAIVVRSYKRAGLR